MTGNTSIAVEESACNQFAPEIVRLDDSAIREAKTILVHAYKDTPIFSYIFESTKPGYLQRVRASIRELLELHFSKQQDVIGLVVKGRLVGVALLGIPEMRMKLTNQLGWRFKMMLTTGLNSTKRYIDYHEKIHNLAPDQEHHQLPLLGIDSDYQNKGLGRLLIKSVIQLAAENGRSNGILLDTGNKDLLGFYQDLGFELIGKINEGTFDELVFFKANRLR